MSVMLNEKLIFDTLILDIKAPERCNGDSGAFAIVQLCNALTVILRRQAVSHGETHSALLRSALLPSPASSRERELVSGRHLPPKRFRPRPQSLFRVYVLSLRAFRANITGNLYGNVLKSHMTIRRYIRSSTSSFSLSLFRTL